MAIKNDVTAYETLCILGIEKHLAWQWANPRAIPSKRLSDLNRKLYTVRGNDECNNRPLRFCTVGGVGGWRDSTPPPR